jgi:hypothetical protein
VQWLANNYLWLLAAVIIPAAGFLLKHYVFTEPAETSLTARAHAPVFPPSNSAVTSGNITNIVNVQPTVPAVPVTPITLTPDIGALQRVKPRLNLQMTGARFSMLLDNYGVLHESFSEDEQGAEALLLRFTNEPGTGVVGGSVKATIAYKCSEPVDVIIIGTWIDMDDEVIRFRVDDSHNLLIGFMYQKRFVTSGRKFIRGVMKGELRDINDVQSIRVRLTDASDGVVLYQGQFRVTLDPLGIHPTEVIGQADVTL